MRVELEGGRVLVLDDEDAHLLEGARPVLHFPYGRSHPLCYVRLERQAAGKKTRSYLHRLIARARAGDIVDHANRDPLDCRKANLRLASRSQNAANARIRGRVPFRGVSRNGRKFEARITVNRVAHRLGRFTTARDAARAYDEAARRFFGEFAALNFPEVSP